MDRLSVYQLILKNAREVVPDLEDHDFQESDSLRDLDVDSVERAEIVTMTLEDLNLDIPRVEVFGPKNLGELASLLHAKLSAQ